MGKIQLSAICVWLRYTRRNIFHLLAAECLDGGHDTGDIDTGDSGETSNLHLGDVWDKLSFVHFLEHIDGCGMSVSFVFESLGYSHGEEEWPWRCTARMEGWKTQESVTIPPACEARKKCQSSTDHSILFNLISTSTFTPHLRAGARDDSFDSLPARR